LFRRGTSGSVFDTRPGLLILQDQPWESDTK
jgi:hypothetical protein